MSVEGRSAEFAEGDAREQEAGVGAAGVGARAWVPFPAVAVLELLNFLPEFGRDDGLAVIFDDEVVTEFEHAFVDLVRPEGGVGVDGAVEAGLVLYLFEGHACGAHLVGLQDARGEFGIGDPFVRHARGPVAVFADADGFAQEAAGRRARHTAMTLDEFTQAALGIGAGLFALFFVAQVNEEFDDAGIVAFGDGVVEGVNDDAPLADHDLVELGVVYIAGEAGMVPEQESRGARFWNFVERHHAVEFITARDGAAAFGFIHEAVTELQAVLYAIGFDGAQLLVGGLFLAGPAAIAHVAIYDGGWRQGGGRGEVHSVFSDQ